MTDWADEVVKTLVTGHQIANALRKAKADGMEAAAKVADEYADAGVAPVQLRNVAAIIRSRAARVEQPR